MTVRASRAQRSSKSQSIRLQLRISQDLHLSIKRAAEINGCTVTDFVVHALQIAVSKPIDQIDHVRLSAVDQNVFSNALIDQAKPNVALKRAFANADKLLVN